MQTRVHRLCFNRGLVSRLGLARADIKRLAMAAEVHTNWMPRVLGSMMLRPGMEYLINTRDDELARYLEFIFSVREKALVELTDMTMRIVVDDALVTRPAVSTTITNGMFVTTIAGWTDADEAGATSDWVATGGYSGLWTPAGLMRLVGTGTAYAIRRQSLTIAGADQGVEHGLNIRVANGPVLLRIGTTAGDDDIVGESSIETGEHHIAFTPQTAAAWVEFKSLLQREILIDQCEMDATGVLEITAPWQEIDLKLVRYDQSGDVLFLACGKTTNRIGYQQWRIERRSTNGWGIALYRPEDGPFRVENVSPITFAVSGLNGNITITASKPVFKATHVGALFRINSIGQNVTATITAQNTFTTSIRVTGVGEQRRFGLIITGLSGSGSTVTLQRSFDGGSTWETSSTYTTDQATTGNDALDNQIILYRLGVKTGDYAGGTIVCQLTFSSGSIAGVARITAVTTSLLASAEVLSAMGATTATDSWAEGKWSDFRGWPTSVAFHEGRLDWSGRDSFDGSISDAFDSFDPDFEGDAGPIARTIGSGPVDTINWMLSLQRLLLGAEMTEFSARSSSLDEPLTPTNFNLKGPSNQGSAQVQAVKIDESGVHVQRGGTRLYELAFGQTGIDYQSTHLSALIPEIGRPGITKIAVQRQPDTRLHCRRSDGTVAVLIFDKVEEVICWIEIETDGEIEDVVVLPGDPGDEEDWVYYAVKRTINGSEVRFLEKWAFESECQGDLPLCKLADAFITYDGAAATVISAPHLAGEDVVVWADGVDVGTDANRDQLYTVSGGGTITLAAAAEHVVVGLPYSAPWKSAKFVEVMSQGSFSDAQLIQALALILADVHPQGLRYGRSLVESEMRDLPLVVDGAVVDPDTVRADYSSEPISFPGGWSQDARLCLLANAPRPCTVMAALATVNHNG